MLKVVQLNKLYYPVTGGVEHVVQQIAEGLNDKVDMTVLVCQEKGKKVSEFIHGVKVVRTGSLGIKFSLPISPGFIFALRNVADKYDTLVLHMPFPLGDLALLLSGYKGRVVIWWHSDIVRQKKLVKLYKLLMNWTLNRADAIIVATEGHIEGSSYLKQFREKCRIIPFGVSDDIYEDASDYLKTVNNENEISRNGVQFLFVGRLVYYKGISVLIESFAEAVKMTNKVIRLRIAGGGPLENSLRKQVDKLGITDRVDFIGKINDDSLKKEYQKCDVFILPSTAKSEAFGLVQIEAMAYGKPVINTSLDSGVPYVSLDGLTGITVMPENQAELAAAIKRLAEDDEFRTFCGYNARKRVDEEYRESVMMDRLLEVLV